MHKTPKMTHSQSVETEARALQEHSSSVELAHKDPLMNEPRVASEGDHEPYAALAPVWKRFRRRARKRTGRASGVTRRLTRALLRHQAKDAAPILRKLQQTADTATYTVSHPPHSEPGHNKREKLDNSKPSACSKIIMQTRQQHATVLHCKIPTTTQI